MPLAASPGGQWLNDWSVDHNSREISIASSIWFGWERSNQNAADQLYQILADEFYKDTSLSETWGGKGLRLGGAGLKMVGGGASIIGGGLLLGAPEPTTLTKIGGVGAITFGTNTFLDGLSQTWRRQGGYNILGEAADAYDESISGEVADEYLGANCPWRNKTGRERFWAIVNMFTRSSQMKGAFVEDASGRITYECLEVTAAQYSSIRDRIVKKFNLTPTGVLTQGFNEMFQDFQRKKSIIGIEWDIWSGLCIIAKTSCAIDLLKDIGMFLQNGEK